MIGRKRNWPQLYCIQLQEHWCSMGQIWHWETVLLPDETHPSSLPAGSGGGENCGVESPRISHGHKPLCDSLATWWWEPAGCPLAGHATEWLHPQDPLRESLKCGMWAHRHCVSPNGSVPVPKASASCDKCRKQNKANQNSTHNNWEHKGWVGGRASTECLSGG